MPKIGRNQPCPCGSGVKFKKCHGQLNESPPTMDVLHARDRHEARERIRAIQQGLGRPIIATKVNDRQVVAVGKTIYWSKEWKTFPDFLGDYIKRKVGDEWGKSELAKPFAARHPLIQWYDAYCRYQQANIKTRGEVQSSTITGIVACYLVDRI